MQTNQTLTLRPALNSDGDALATIMAACFLQFPNCLFDVKENADISQPATNYRSKGGTYLVLQNATGQVVGGAGIKRGNPKDIAPAVAEWELSRFYIAPNLQGAGAGSFLIKQLLWFAALNTPDDDRPSIVAWSDTRFTGAYAFYEKHGLAKQPLERELHDISESREYAFIRN